MDALPSGSMLLRATGVGNAPLVKIMQERVETRAGAGTVGEVDGRSGGGARAEAERARRGMLFAAVSDDDGGKRGYANVGDADDGTR